ncbi:Pleckstrin homology domain-containing protein [Irpex rosettiformis]|uniref:Pleckstrin homology domain-containing protein n=1 Tax=Irpex rosettiformis TaxID=378272 RepID=A0ACB8TNE2_9APHY|nr:Pleckstrin homology domain-containing protein [Irpex rosettiformis]
MKVGDGDGGKSNKLAALTGMGGASDILYPGRETPSGRPGIPHRPSNAPQPPKQYNPNEDDPVEHVNGKNAGPLDSGHYIVAPSIQVRSEFATLTRTNETSQPLTCIVVIELPGKRPSTHVPGSVMQSTDFGRGIRPESQTSGHNSPASRHMSPLPDYNYQRSPSELHSPSGSQSHGYGRPNMRSPAPPDSTRMLSPSNSLDPISSSPSRSPPPPRPQTQSDEDSPFNAITEDLRNRIIDWKGHPLSEMGPLQMYDLLSVRRDAIVREFFVYLFKDAIICVSEEKKRSLGRLLGSDPTGSGIAGGSTSNRGVLRLKGRIYIKHIKQVTDTSVSGEMSLTIDMEDERLESFILIFKERSSLETWKSHIQSLVNISQQQGILAMRQQQQQQQQGHSQYQQGGPDLEEFGGSSKAMRMLSGSTGTTVSTVDSLLHSSARSTVSSNTSHGSASVSRMDLQNHQHQLSPLHEDEEINSRYGAPAPLVAPHMSAGPSNSLQPLPHPPLDLILVISVPPPNAQPSTAALKMRLIRTSLDFIMASMGARDRLSLVTFEVGVGGKVRKTPFLCAGKPQSRARLTKFVDLIGRREEGGVEDEFLTRTSQDDKTDVVTAVNHGLDVVLQRKSRNPIAGMILVSDAADTTRRAQMDLVLARAEAANLPIHSFGYGRSHDPASLWLMSNHTSGTYTFVKDWYDLRDCLAGCIGGMMSIGLLNMKMHIKIVDGQRFRIRKVSGGPSAILSSDGRDVDVDVGEVRYGEKKEMLIELELDNTDAMRAAERRAGAQRALSATEQWQQSMGLDALSISDSPDLADGMMDGMIDEVPVFEVDGSFFDPNAGKNVSRLGHPVLLTVTLLPNSNNSRAPSSSSSDPVIVRRRMELLASDMITRALVLVSRKNFSQAQKLLSETRRILHTVLQSITQNLPPPVPGRESGTARNRKELLTLSAVRAIQSVLQDMQILSEALDENVDLFAHDQRNFGAQQAMVLRDQKSWSGRSAIERLFWTIDNSIELVSRSTDWVARE